MEERLQKLLSAAGLCSRRTAEEWISAGRVSLNGHTAVLGERADPDRDDVRLDGKSLRQAEKKVYLMLNKPRGYVTTLSDERGRRTVAELVADVPARVYPVGRLDMDSEGLLLLTNDGALMQRLIHPKFQIDKTYLVTVAGPCRGAAARLSQITDLDGESIRPAQVETVSETEGSAQLKIVIHEGKNRQIRRMCAQCGLSVQRLRRVKENELELKNLSAGQWRYLTNEEIDELICES